LTLPLNWQPIISLEPFSLKAKEQQVRAVAVSIPLNFPAGSYEVPYSVRSETDPTVIIKDTLSVVVLTSLNLESNVEEKPIAIVAGEVYKVRLSLVNKGNARNRIKIEIKGEPNYPLKIEPSEIVLEAGKSRILSIEVKTDEKLNKRMNHILKIKAETEDTKGGVVATDQTILVDIIPRVTGDFDPYHRIPAYIRATGIESNGEGGFQLQFAGAGDLDEEGKRKIEFLFRGPNTQDISPFGERDEYRISYYDRLFDVHLGDRPYSLSPLTEQFKYGTGAEADYHPGRLGMGGFFSYTRFDEPREREIGTYLAYKISEVFQVKGNFLNKAIPDRDFSDNLFGIQGRIRPNEKLDLGLEYAYGLSNRESNLSDHAYRVDLNGRLSENFFYSFEKIYAGAKFFGYYNGADYTTGAINFPIYDKLKGNLSYRETKDNRKVFDLAQEIENRERSIRGGLSYAFPFGTNVSLDYEDFQREDKLLPADFDFSERLFRLGLGQTFRRFSLQAFWDTGKLDNKQFPAKSANLERYSIYGNFQLSDWQSYSLYTQFGNNLYTDDPSRATSWGISGNWRIMNRLNINVNYNYYKNAINVEKILAKKQTQDNIFSTITYTLPNQHFIAFRTRWMKSRDGTKESETFFDLSYTIPLKIPVGKKKTIGMIKGRVYDGEKPGRPQIPNVILTANGANAVTDQKGQFIFPGLKPGSYYLQVEKGSIGLNRTTSEKLATVVVKGGETAEIEIAVVNSCKVSGRIIRFAPKDNSVNMERLDTQNLKETGGLADILVEIAKGNEVLRQLTDEKGKFSFEELRPGNWALKVDKDNLPPNHYLEKEGFLVELKPAEEKEIIIKVLPRIRKIEIIEEGVIKEERKK
jgi:hypothetical protein